MHQRDTKYVDKNKAAPNSDISKQDDLAQFAEGNGFVFFELLNFIYILNTPIPTPRLYITRFFNVFVTSNNIRAQLTVSQRTKYNNKVINQEYYNLIISR